VAADHASSDGTHISARRRGRDDMFTWPEQTVLADATNGS